MEPINYKNYRHQIVYDGRFVSNWFSNMRSSPLKHPSLPISYATVEHLYQAMKTDNMIKHWFIANAETPYKAKKEGKEIENPFGYAIGKYGDTVKEVKLTVMQIALEQKFAIPEWKEKLLTIRENEPIIEWNNWNDIFWGVSVKDNKGENNLGKLIMEIRSKLL